MLSVFLAVFVTSCILPGKSILLFDKCQIDQVIQWGFYSHKTLSHSLGKCATGDDDRFVFIAEWYDPNAALIRKYQFMYYVKDNSIEMYDIKNRRLFLKRMKTDKIRLEDLFVGGSVEVNSRTLNFVDYGDEYTRQKLSRKQERTLGMIKPDCVPKMGQIFDVICQNGFLMTRIKMTQLTKADAMEFYQEHSSKAFFNDLLRYITSGPVVAFEIVGDGAVNAWRKLLGPTDATIARKENPASIRARFGKDKTQNACHGSDSVQSATRELEFFFPSAGPSKPNTATFSEVTCCVIKPHAVLKGIHGSIIQAIQDAGFEVSAVQMFRLERANAEEFLEVYKGVVQEYASMVDELVSGPCLVLEVRALEAPLKFREMCGPADPEIARHLRPRTLRARFGESKIKNAVHCTDLPEDALLEVEYFFKVLDR